MDTNNDNSRKYSGLYSNNSNSSPTPVKLTTIPFNPKDGLGNADLNDSNDPSPENYQKIVNKNDPNANEKHLLSSDLFNQIDSGPNPANENDYHHYFKNENDFCDDLENSEGERINLDAQFENSENNETPQKENFSPKNIEIPLNKSFHNQSENEDHEFQTENQDQSKSPNSDFNDFYIHHLINANFHTNQNYWFSSQTQLPKELKLEYENKLRQFKQMNQPIQNAQINIFNDAHSGYNYMPHQQKKDKNSNLEPNAEGKIDIEQLFNYEKYNAHCANSENGLNSENSSILKVTKSKNSIFFKNIQNSNNLLSKENESQTQIKELSHNLDQLSIKNPEIKEEIKNTKKESELENDNKEGEDQKIEKDEEIEMTNSQNPPNLPINAAQSDIKKTLEKFLSAKPYIPKSLKYQQLLNPDAEPFIPNTDYQYSTDVMPLFEINQDNFQKYENMEYDNELKKKNKSKKKTKKEACYYFDNTVYPPKMLTKKEFEKEYITEMFGRKGWICESCNNFNYCTRNKCNRCGIPKYPKKISVYRKELGIKFDLNENELPCQRTPSSSSNENFENFDYYPYDNDNIYNYSPILPETPNIHQVSKSPKKEPIFPSVNLNDFKFEPIIQASPKELNSLSEQKLLSQLKNEENPPNNSENHHSKEDRADNENHPTEIINPPTNQINEDINFSDNRNNIQNDIINNMNYLFSLKHKKDNNSINIIPNSDISALINRSLNNQNISGINLGQGFANNLNQSPNKDQRMNSGNYKAQNIQNKMQKGKNKSTKNSDNLNFANQKGKNNNPNPQNNPFGQESQKKKNQQKKNNNNQSSNSQNKQKRNNQNVPSQNINNMQFMQNNQQPNKANISKIKNPQGQINPQKNTSKMNSKNIQKNQQAGQSSNSMANNENIENNKGNWLCPKCKNLNYFFRNTCNRCHLQKSKAQKKNIQSTTANIGNGQNISNISNSQNVANPNFQMSPGFVNIQPSYMNISNPYNGEYIFPPSFLTKKPNSKEEEE